jgi:hypothetical protein
VSEKGINGSITWCVAGGGDHSLYWCRLWLTRVRRWGSVIGDNADGTSLAGEQYLSSGAIVEFSAVGGDMRPLAEVAPGAQRVAVPRGAPFRTSEASPRVTASASAVSKLPTLVAGLLGSIDDFHPFHP